MAMKRAWDSFLTWLEKHLRKQFLAGILVVVPLGITILMLAWIFNYIDDILQPAITAIAGHPIQGVGFGITVILIYLSGVIASSVGGKAIIRFNESIVGKVPIVRQVYHGIKQILESFSKGDRTTFMQVVLIEFPRKGARTIGFVTNESTTAAGKKLLNVFVPTTPNPTSGFLQIVEESEIIRTRISVEDALKIVISAGKMSLHEISASLPRDNQAADSDQK